MIFFNNSEYRVYINGNIIDNNLLFNIENFNEQIVPLINNNITNYDVIDILYKVFIDASGDDLDYPYDCIKYENVKFKTLKHDGIIYLNDNKFTVDTFLDKYNDFNFGINDIILLSKNIEYKELLTKENTSEDVNSDNN